MLSGITMRLTRFLRSFRKLIRDHNEASSADRAGEQRDQSSMADFVRILQNLDNGRPADFG
jgi:hypothetical protein